MRTLICIFTALLLLSVSCAKHTPIAHPNQISTFDGYAYDTLMTAQAAINSAKADVVKYPAMKEPLNQAILVYNTADAAYKLYHTNGKFDATIETQLGQQLQELVAAITNVVQAKGTK